MILWKEEAPVEIQVLPCALFMVSLIFQVDLPPTYWAALEQVSPNVWAWVEMLGSITGLLPQYYVLL